MKNLNYYLKWFLRFGIGIAAIYCLIIQNWTGLGSGIAIFLSTYIIEFVNRNNKCISDRLTSIYYVFCVFAVVLGSMFNFYKLISWWDIVIHLTSGVILCIVGQAVFVKYSNSNALPFMFRFLFLIGFVCLGGVIWEMYEYFIDCVFGIDAQCVVSSGIGDTMGDLLADLLGGICTSFFVGNR